MANKKLFAGITAAVAVLGVGASLLTTTRGNIFRLDASEQTYSVILDVTNANTLTATSTGGAEIKFAAEGLTASEGKLGVLAKDGYITLAENYSLNNLKSFAVVCDNNKAIELSYGFTAGTWVREGLKDWVPSTAGEESLLNEHPNYIKLTANAEVSITSVKFTYSASANNCTTPTAKPSIYNDIDWQIVGAHNSWNTSTGNKFTLNTKNANMEYVEFMTSVKFAENSEFKIIKGADWSAFNKLSVSGDAIPNLITMPSATTGADRSNAKAKFGYEFTFYYRINYADKSAYVWIPTPTNPVEKDDTDTTRIYFEKPASYGATVYAHYWDNYGNGTSWPGVKMTLESGNLYYVDYNTKFYTNVLFHDNTTANKTPDLVSPTDGINVKFVVGAGWVEKDFSEEVSTEMNIYVDVTGPKWTKVNAHMWDGSLAGTNWPGIALTKVSGNIWKVKTFELGQYNKIIFNNGSGKQTADLTLPLAAGSHLFTLNSSGNNGTWSTYTPA